jgi:hypothetical protein
MSTKKTPKNAKKFSCDICTFICSKKSEWDRHVITKKHLINTNCASINTINHKNALIKNFIFQYCNKEYSCRSGLWRHNENCNSNNKIMNMNDHDNIDDPDPTNMNDHNINYLTEFDDWYNRKFA